MAERCQVSEATVFRFSKKLSFDGYQDLKITLAQENVEGLKAIRESLSPEDDCQAIVAKVFGEIYNTLEHTRSVISYDRMEQAASLILGALWAAWHFHPANFKALLSIGGGLVALNILLTAIVFTWVYNHTRGSLLIAVLFHMTLNVAEYVVPIGIADASLTRHLLQLALLVMVAAALVRTSGPSLGKEHLPAPSGGAVGPPAG